MLASPQFLLMFQFDKIDVDGNGTIDIDEVTPSPPPRMLGSIASPSPSPTRLSMSPRLASRVQFVGALLPGVAKKVFEDAGKGKVRACGEASCILHPASCSLRLTSV